MFITKVRRRYVAPYNWIENLKDHLEKFINRGLNRNQIFTVFWTDNPDAFDENNVPRQSYQPNFAASSHRKFPREGLYDCKLVYVRCKYFSLIVSLYIIIIIKIGIVLIYVNVIFCCSKIQCCPTVYEQSSESTTGTI